MQRNEVTRITIIRSTIIRNYRRNIFFNYIINIIIINARIIRQNTNCSLLWNKVYPI